VGRDDADAAVPAAPLGPPADAPGARPVKRECIECKKLPEGERPKEWRPIDKRSGPRSPRCNTHIEGRRQVAAVAQQDKNRRDRHDMSREEFNEIAAFQRGVCPCGRKIKHIDHNHKLAKSHGHPRNKSCRRCWRGLLCHMCNSYILGRGYTSAMLRALADYYDNPPVLQMWGEEES
jgi:hypothetical protein